MYIKYIYLISICLIFLSCKNKEDLNSLDPLLIENIGDISSIMLNKKLDTIIEIVESSKYNNLKIGDTLTIFIRKDTLTILERNYGFMASTYIKKYSNDNLLDNKIDFSHFKEKIKYKRYRLENFIIEDVSSLNSLKKYTYFVDNEHIKNKTVNDRKYPMFKDSILYYFDNDKLSSKARFIENMPNGELADGIYYKKYFWNDSNIMIIAATYSFVNNKTYFKNSEIITYSKDGIPKNKIMINNSDTLLISKFNMR